MKTRKNDDIAAPDAKRTHYTVKNLANKASIDNSELMSQFRLHESLGLIRIKRIHPHAFLNLYNSTKNNLKSSYNDELTDYAKQLDDISWAKLYKTVLQWIKDNMIPSVYDMSEEYFKTTLPYPISWYDARGLADVSSEYGFNYGKWDDRAKALYNIGADAFAKQFSWYTDFPWPLPDIGWNTKALGNKSQLYYWNELLLEIPMMSILNLKATSGWPYYKKQGIDFILNHYVNASRHEPGDHNTLYKRSQGAKIERTSYSFPELNLQFAGDKNKTTKTLGHDEYYATRMGFLLTQQRDPLIPQGQVSSIKIKGRRISGGEFDNKMWSLPFSYSFKLSRPALSMYYNEWYSMMHDEMAKWYQYALDHDGVVHSLDISKHDGSHNGSVLRNNLDRFFAVMPKRNRDMSNKVTQGSYFKNHMVANSAYEIIYDRATSASGDPHTPAVETMTTIGLTTGGLSLLYDVALDTFEDIKSIMPYIKVQIDDSFIVILDDKFDLPAFTEKVATHYGFTIHADKTESSANGYVIALQNMIGKLFTKPVLLLNGLKDDVVNVLGVIFRRLHRMRRKERYGIMGDVLFLEYDDESPDGFKEADVDVQQFLGVLQSFGPELPIELLEIILTAFKGTEIMRKVYSYCRRRPFVLKREYGYGNDLLIRWIAENGEKYAI